MTGDLASTARRILPWIVVTALVCSWWLSLIIMWDTPLLDVTPPKLVVLLGGLALVAARPWAGLRGRQWLPVLLIGAYLGWFPVAALLRGATADLRTAGAYLVFAGLAAGIAFTALRFQKRRASSLLAWVVILVAVVSFGATLVERATYPLPGQPDALEGLWSFFRPQVGMVDPRLGDLPAPPLHAPTGEPGVPRATAFFVQTNYLAFFAMLAVPLLTILFTIAIRRRRLVAALLTGAVLGVTLLTAFWTYARVGIVAVAGAAVAALLVEWLSDSDRRRLSLRRADLAPTLAALALVAAVLGGALLFDGVGLSRFTGTTLGDDVAAEEPGPGQPPDSPAESAARSASIRIELQRTALAMISEQPRSLLMGPGLAAFETAVHDPASPRYMRDAFAIRDPNSLWLTVSLAGGLVALGLLAILLAHLVWRLARSVAHVGEGWPRLVVLWLAAWLPVWAVVQFLGTNPFNTSEAIIFGTLIGAIAGVTTRSGNADEA